MADTPPTTIATAALWYDGKLVPWRGASRLHVLSHGLHYASAVFEGERAYNGVIFRTDAAHPAASGGRRQDT